MPAKIRLLIIDPQNDFCDGPSNGSLPVSGAYDDMTRLAGMIDGVGQVSGLSDGKLINGPCGVFYVTGQQVYRLSLGAP